MHAKRYRRAEKIDDVRYPATLDALERRIEEFKNHNRSFLTDLGSRKHVEDAVEALKTNTYTRNAMKVFDEGRYSSRTTRKGREKRRVKRYCDCTTKRVASCLFACESDDAEELKRMIQRHDDDAASSSKTVRKVRRTVHRKFRKRHEKKCPLYECSVR